MKIDNSLPLEYSTEENKLKILGFWIFLGAEIMLFATLFACVFHIMETVLAMDQLDRKFLKLLQY